MKYMGSKRRIVKEILPIILKDRKPDQYYVEPFVRGGNVIEKVTGNRIAGDNNRYLIALFKKMQEGATFIPSVGELNYSIIRDNKDKYDDWLVGYVGFQLSFGAKFFGGYRRDKIGVRDYEKEAQNNIRKQQPFIKGVEFYHSEYWELPIPKNSIIYCDPPYANTTKYSKDFDHNKFWLWCEHMVKNGHKVFVSEYAAPSHWNIVWEKEVKTQLDVSDTKVAVEKLFTLV